MLEIRKPEMTKKISTPINPPGIRDGKAWKPTTESTATAQRPSISERNFGCACEYIISSGCQNRLIDEICMLARIGGM